MRPENLDKYLYIQKTPTWLVRVLYSTGILTWFGVIYGYSRFFEASTVLFFIVAPFVGFIIVHHLLSYFIALFYRQFDLEKHKFLLTQYDCRKLSADGNSFPSVDIFLPICGEKSEVLEKTFLAVSRLDYPDKKVYVLDDKGIQEHKLLAKKSGFMYLSRKNKGHMKKAGNLKHGFERSAGDFIVIFDADFAPHPDFIKELLPYMSDPRVGIVQSPQYFQTDGDVYRRSWLEYGAAHVQEDFYRFIQVVRSRLGAPICCGSNAIYRRRALDAIGGITQIEHSEDAYTGFELLHKGWKVKYVPIILAVGLCPADLPSYFHQQHRWASGSLSLMLSKKFWKSNLSFSQKLCFISGFMYYLSHPITILLSFQIFLLLFLFHDSLNIWSALPFIPCVLFAFFLVPLFRITWGRLGGPLARNSYLYSYSYAALTAFFNKAISWQPVGAKSAGVSKAYIEQLSFAAGCFLVYMSFVGFSIGMGVMNVSDADQYSLIFWVFYNIISTTFILSHFYFSLHNAWRLKTIGGYIVVLSLFFFSAMLLPQYYSEHYILLYART